MSDRSMDEMSLMHMEGNASQGFLSALQLVETHISESIKEKGITAATSSANQKTRAVIPQHLIPPFPPFLSRLPETSSSFTSNTATTGISSSSSSRSSGNLDLLLQTLERYVLPHLNLSSLSPNYYGFVTGGVTPAAALGDLLVTAYDQNVAVHLPAETIATNVEVAALNMLVDLFRLPRCSWGIRADAGDDSGSDVDVDGIENGGGTFTTGATASNVLGLALGREWVLRERVRRKARAAKGEDGTGIDQDKSLPASISVGNMGLFESMRAAGVEKIQILSTLPHSSIAKAASIVGIGRSNIVSLASDGEPLKINLDLLRIEAKKPGVANILTLSTGEVNTGWFATSSLSDMQTLREICDEYGIWMHVDGAFGLFASVLPHEPDDLEYSAITGGVQGMHLADSITGDGHKLLNVPYDCGFFFTRHKALSGDVFQNGNAAYLMLASGSAGADGIQSPLNIGLENSRRFRALPVFATLRAYGREGYADMLKRQIGLARAVTRFLAMGNLKDHFEILPRPLGARGLEDTIRRTFMIVLFRATNPELNTKLVKKINASGRMYVSGTVWGGQPASRIAISNWQVDVDRDLTVIESVLTNIITEWQSTMREWSGSARMIWTMPQA